MKGRLDPIYSECLCSWMDWNIGQLLFHLPGNLGERHKHKHWPRNQRCSKRMRGRQSMYRSNWWYKEENQHMNSNVCKLHDECSFLSFTSLRIFWWLILTRNIKKRKEVNSGKYSSAKLSCHISEPSKRKSNSTAYKESIKKCFQGRWHLNSIFKDDQKGEIATYQAHRVNR